jgi:DNA polymerase III delta prime subunit
LKDFELDSQIVQLLQTLIKIDNLNILFVGDSGSSKTCLLNALIREYYSNSYNPDNILHINNLKEQGINFYRNDVKTFCQTFSNVPKKKKIIVLDDIDNIHETSQQVFRNCIDKYNNNVHFIGSCTNINKVIESIQSRFIIIKIKKLNKENLKSILYKIKTRENLIFTQDAERFILDISNNSAKILIHYMEKLHLCTNNISNNVSNDVSSNEITLETINNICTNINFSLLEEYTHLIKGQKISEAILLLYNIYNKGYSVMDILDNYFIFVKITELLTEDEKYIIIPFLCKYITIFYNIHEDEIELALFTNNLYKSLLKL